MNTKTNIATAIVAISDPEATKKAMIDILSASSLEFQNLFAGLVLGVINWPDDFCSDKKNAVGQELHFKALNLNTTSVEYTYEDSETRYFEDEERAEFAIKNGLRYAGYAEPSKEHPIAASIGYIATNNMPITSWIQLTKEGE